MKIVVASGKGGTGKTTVATSLTLSLAAQGQELSFLECDVEASRDRLPGDIGRLRCRFSAYCC
jgi:MinD superfamily P-loop ATPase